MWYCVANVVSIVLCDYIVFLMAVQADFSKDGIVLTSYIA